MQHALIAILAAGVAGWIFGAIWYTSLGKVWQQAQGLDPEACKGQKMPMAPLAVAFVGALVMSAVLYQLISNLGVMGVAPSALAGFTVGVGFLFVATLVNNMFQRRSFTLTLIDGGHWVLVVVIESVVIALLA
ncbi:MAG TPA: DUF1761 domain-containing protein [Rhizomicrobium sp.]|nr:DUF1761 domain-containing protein [Rhizomicrobium sp.]